MGQHTAKQGATCVKRASDRDEGTVRWLDSGPVLVGIDLDQHGQRIVPLDAFCRHQFRDFQIVENDRQIGAAASQVEHVIELVRGDAHRIEQIRDAVTEEVLSLPQRRDCYRPLCAVHHQPGDVNTLRGLEMRTKPDPKRLQMPLQPRDVRDETRFFQDQTRRLQIVERLTDLLA